MKRSAPGVPVEYTDPVKHRKMLGEAIRELAVEMPVVGSWDGTPAEATAGGALASIAGFPQLIGSVRPRRLVLFGQLKVEVTSAVAGKFQAALFLDGSQIGRLVEWEVGAKAVNDTVTLPIVADVNLVDAGQRSVDLRIRHSGGGYSLESYVVNYQFHRSGDR